ncbi:MAG: hypothetical protein JW797_18090 [Bradymonadales bacterium]|nr:hypothetical protein [Bradymonadales bacterium]
MAGSKEHDEWGKSTDLDPDDSEELEEELEEDEPPTPEEPTPKRSRTDREETQAADEIELEDYFDDEDSDDYEGLDAEGEEYLDLEPEIEDLGDGLPDDYWSYIDEEMGYADINPDNLPKAEVDLQAQIRGLSPSELDDLDLDTLTDYCRWGAARTYLEHGDESSFEKIALTLVNSTDRSPALDYADITLALICRMASRSDFQAAFDLLTRLGEVAPESPELVERFRGVLTIQQGRITEGLELLNQLAERYADDACFLLALGEDLCGLGQWEEALEYLEMARDIARGSNDQELLSSIDNAVQYAQRHIRYQEAEGL